MKNKPATDTLSPPNRRGIWLLRVLLAVILAFCSEIVVWSSLLALSPLDWLLLPLAYLGLASVLLELIVRYRVYDFYGMLLLAAVFGVSTSIVLHPQVALADLPRTLVTRVTGQYSLAGLLALGLFLSLTGGVKNRLPLLLAASVGGLLAGLWTRWFPIEAGFGEVSLSVMLVAGAVGLVLVAFALTLSLRAGSFPPGELRLTFYEWIALALLTTLLVTVRLLRGQIGGLALTNLPLLLVFFIMILWWARRKRVEHLLEGRVPPHQPQLMVIGLASVLFLSLSAVGYSLPGDADGTRVTPYSVLSVGVLVYGLFWLPTLVLVLGIRAYGRQLRASRY